VATAQSATSTSPLFVTDRYGISNGALGCRNSDTNTFWKVPAGVYFAGGDFTVTFWAQIYSFQQYDRLFEFGNAYTSTGGSDNVELHLNAASSTTGNNIGIGIVPPATTGQWGKNTVFPKSVTVPTNVWNHFGVTAASGTVIMYQNGILITNQTGQWVPRSISRTQNFFCKNNQSVNSNFLDGDIDDVKIFSRALSAAEISSDYGV
jgi:hypothetical protein